jgi:hypothetical protein
MFTEKGATEGLTRGGESVSTPAEVGELHSFGDGINEYILEFDVSM